MREPSQMLCHLQLQAMAQSQYKDLVLGDSVKLETSIDDLVAGFSLDKPLVFQVCCCSVVGSGFRTLQVLVNTTSADPRTPWRCSAALAPSGPASPGYA